MDSLTAYGFLSVSLMLLFYALEARSHWFVLAFAVTCVMSSIYGFLQGAWPFGMVEAIWAIVAFRRWWVRPKKVNGDDADIPNAGVQRPEPEKY